MWPLSDESLLAGFASGDPQSVAAFVRRFQRQVYGLALRLLRDPHAAEEVAQDAFVRAWRYARAYDPRRGEVETWLLTITRNLARDAARFRRPEPLDPESILMLPLPDTEPGPEEQAVGGRPTPGVRDAIAKLPQDQMRAVVLAALGGHTAREISESEGIPVGTAKTRIRTGMLKLRSALEAAYEG